MALHEAVVQRLKWSASADQADWGNVTDEQHARFKRATDHLQPLAAIGHFAGMDGLVAGAAALIVFAAISFAGAPEVVSYLLALTAAYLVGRSVGKEKWRWYSEACEAELAAIRRGQ